MVFSGNFVPEFPSLHENRGDSNAVKPKLKIALAVLVLALIAGGVVASVKWGQKDLVTVQTGLAGKSDLVSVVTASGEIKPRNYINIGANAQGRITQLLVKEGDHVRKDQVVARI